MLHLTNQLDRTLDNNTRQEPTLVLGGPGKTWANQVERKTVSSAPESRTAHARDAAATGIWNATAHAGRLTSSGSRHPQKEANMHRDTTIGKPGNGNRQRLDGDYAHQAAEDRATVHDPTGADDRNAGIVLGAAVVAMGLLAGLFYAFDVAVMPALTAADDRTLVDAMQQMIDKIENPFFYLTLLGAPALASVALVQARRSGSPKIAGWIVAGLAFYTVMVVVTFAVHFPLNEDLKQAGDPARIDNLAAVRDDFVTPWVAWNIVRTLASTAAFGSLTWALVLRGRMGRAEQPRRTEGSVRG